MEKKEQMYEGKAKKVFATENPDYCIGKVNVDDQPELASRFGIDSIPTVVMMKNGVITGTAVGYRPKSELEKLL